MEIEDALAGLPWETLRLPGPDGTAGPLLALHPSVRLFRAIADLGPTPALPIPGPLRILVAIGSPEEQNARGELLDMERELSRILDAVEPARKQERPAYVRVIDRGTVKAIRDALQIERYHVLHVTCHAGPGVLVLEKEDGSADRVTAQRFCDEALPPGRGVPLVVLAGCATALAEQGESALPGLARQLLARGVPTVLAMQAPVSDPYATELGARLYGALATFEHPDPLAALAEARRSLEIDREDGNISSPVDLAEWATPALYLRGPSQRLYDPEGPIEKIQPPPEPRFATGVVVRRVGEFVGRRREERRILQALRDPDGAGVLLHGIGGVGKSSLAAEVLKALSEDGWVVASVFSRVSPDDLLSEVGQRLLLRFQGDGVDEADPRRRLAGEIRRSDIDWEERFETLAQNILKERPLIVLLDNFEDNLDADFKIRNQDLADLLSRWLQNPGDSRLLITSRQPFELPEEAHTYLERLHLGPLSFPETRKLMWRLPGLDALLTEDQLRAYANVGGHPRALEYLDALLRGGKGRFKDIAIRMEGALKKKGIEAPKAWLQGVKGDLDRALAETVTLAVDNVLLDDLLARLKDVSLAEDLLIGASVYQVPVDVVALAWQVGEELEVAEDSAPQVPLQVPEDFGSTIEALLTLGLLAPIDSGSEILFFFVHRWTATALLSRTPLEKKRTAHSRAARYWQWRVEKTSHSLEEHLQARFHHREAEEIDAAVEITASICSQLDTWGAYRREEQLCREVLEWVPEKSPAAANFSGQLGIVAQKRGDYTQASDWHEKSLQIDEDLGNRAGIARSYHQLGIVLQVRGDYDKALDWYKKSLQISEDLGNRAEMAFSYHQLGLMSEYRGDYDEALDWYKKSLQILEELGNRARMAISYHQLGIVAQKRGDYDQAMAWYKKSLQIKEELGNRAGMANTYHQLGRVLEDRGDYDQALDWYKKSLQINEDLGTRAELASTISQLGVLSTKRGSAEEGVPFNLRSLAIRLQIGSPEAWKDLHWLSRQREILGESRFGEILREHLDEESRQVVLELMEDFSKDGGEVPPDGEQE
ncbi:MAG TPA: tetratricopeptide repeat protein [Thermoanaerobaculia bacterium]|nr:tetratricopeptide repeat protein [Thermoanaerobaculia bacterium]